jgi:hypothetical protein
MNPLPTGYPVASNEIRVKPFTKQGFQVKTSARHFSLSVHTPFPACSTLGRPKRRRRNRLVDTLRSSTKGEDVQPMSRFHLGTRLALYPVTYRV